MTYSVMKIPCEISNYVLVNVKEIMWWNIKGVLEEVDTENGKNGNDENKQKNCVWKVGKRKMKY